MIVLLAPVLWWFKGFGQFSSRLALAQTQTVINVVDYGADGSDLNDDSLAVQSALNEAAKISSTQSNTNVKVFFPPGHYIINSIGGLVVPSNVTLLGSTIGESVIVNSHPGFVFTTRDWNDTSSYLMVAKADDNSAHPAVPNNSYKGLNYVYLKDLNDIQELKKLGVPSTVTSSYSGLKSAVASGATLGNNYGSDVPQGSNPKLVLQKDNGVNPTPVNFNNILAVDETGKVTLKDKSQFNWGVDMHAPNESLANYYNPSYSYSYNNIVTGPAWLVPAHKYHHNINFENLVFEADTAKSGQLHETYGLYIGYAYNVSVNNCKFRNLPGAYPILTIRTHNILIKNSQFTVQGYQGVALDSGSGFKLYNNTFTGGDWPGASSLNLPPTALNFIAFDELPINIDIVANQFSNLRYVSSEDGRSGKVIYGVGGTYLKVINNTFTNIERAIIQTFSFNSWAIVASNVMQESQAFLFSGTGAGMVNVYNNRYTGSTSLRTDGKSFDSYNYSGSPTNYVCNNYGVTINQWYYPTTYLASNYYQNGRPITDTNLINVGGYSGAYDVVQVSGKLNPVEISSINLSATSIAADSQASIQVNLSAPTTTDFPFYLIVTDGNLDAVKFQRFLLYVPAGEQQVNLSNEVLGLKRGQATISAKPLCSTSTQSASANLIIQ